MIRKLIFPFLLLLAFSMNCFAEENVPSYCLIYVAVDNESDLNAVAERVNQLTLQAEKEGARYLFFMSKGASPRITTKPEEARQFINEIFSFGTKPSIIPELEMETLFREIAKNDFAKLDADMNMVYLTGKVRFHFIINKLFVALNYQQKIIGKLLTACMLDKVKTQDCDFYTTLYYGKDLSARNNLNSISPLGELFPFSYNKNISDDK